MGFAQILTRQSRNQRGEAGAHRERSEIYSYLCDFILRSPKSKGSFEQAADLRQRLIRVQDFGLTGAENIRNSGLISVLVP